MAESTTTSRVLFSFAQPKPVLEEQPIQKSYLAAPGRWDNYSDDKLYEMECLLREWLETKRGGWGSSSQSARKFTAKMVYKILYGENTEPTPAETKRMNRLLNHYASRKYCRDKKTGKDNRTTIFGKQVRCNVYLLKASKLDNPPYGLRLRLEWLAEHGKLPTFDNMRLENDKARHPGRAGKDE